MRTYIKKLQTKSETSRKQILFVALIVSMFLVGSIWIYSLTNRFDDKVQVKAKEDIKPFALFGDSISNTYKNITASVGNISLPSKTETKPEKQIDLIVVDKSANQ
jgi:hypothetical protein